MVAAKTESRSLFFYHRRLEVNRGCSCTFVLFEKKNLRRFLLNIHEAHLSSFEIKTIHIKPSMNSCAHAQASCDYAFFGNASVTASVRPNVFSNKKIGLRFTRHGLIHRARLYRARLLHPTPPHSTSSPPSALHGHRPPYSAAPAPGSPPAWLARPPIS
jgi:hypothetical protein